MPPVSDPQGDFLDLLSAALMDAGTEGANTQLLVNITPHKGPNAGKRTGVRIIIVPEDPQFRWRDPEVDIAKDKLS